MKKTVITAAVLAAMAVSPMAAAEEGSSYIGIGAGNASWELANESALLADDWAIDNEATGLKIFGGKQISENLSVEGYYAYLGEITITDTWGWYAPITADAGLGGIAGVAKLPINESFSVHAKAGAHYWSAEIMDAYYSETDSGISFMFGAGMQVEGEKLFARLEVESYGLDEADVVMTTASIGMKF